METPHRPDDIFISYSRKDIAFARLILESLEKSGFKIWIDWDRIHTGVPWWENIEKAIQDSNTFLFIISKTSIASPICKDEVNTALLNNKRIIPVIVDNLSPEAVGEFVPDLRKINWTIFQRERIFHVEINPEVDSDKPEDREVALPGLPQFELALEKLSREIHTDWDWVTYHTRLQTSALAWEEGKQDSSFLLRGVLLEESERRLLEAAGKDPQPTLLQSQFVTASRQEETRRQAAERALEQKASRRQRLFLWAVGIGLILSFALMLLFLNQRDQYLAETFVRATAESVAVDQRNIAQDQAQTALSRQLAAQSENFLTNSNWELAGLLAVQAGQAKNTGEAYDALRKVEAHPWFTQWVQHDHPLGIDQFDWSTDETRLLTAGCDTSEKIGQTVTKTCSVNVWNLTTRSRLFQLTGFKNPLANALFSPDESKILTVSAAEDSTMQLWDSSTGKLLFTLGSKLNYSRWHPTENIIQARTSTSDQTLQYWNAKTGQQVPAPATSWSDTPAPRLGLAALPSNARRMQVVEISTGKPRFEVEGVYGSFSPDEALLYTKSCKAEKCETWNEDKLIIWDTSTGKSLVTITPNAYFIQSVTWANSSTRLLVLGCDSLGENNNPTFCAKMSVKIWNALTGNLIQTLNADIQNARWFFSWAQDDTQVISSGCDNISNPGRSAICTANSLRQWDVASGKTRWEIVGPDSFRWSQDKQRILTYNQNPTSTLREEGDVIKVWDAASGTELYTLAGHTDLIQTAAWSKDRSTILSASLDGEIRLWQLNPSNNRSETGSLSIPFIRPSSSKQSYAVWSPDHSRFITLVNDKTITVWDELTGSALFSISPYIQKADGLTWNANGTRIISNGCKIAVGRTCQTYEVNQWDGKTGTLLKTYGGFTDTVTLLWSPDEQKFLTIDKTGKLEVWNATSGMVEFNYSDKNARVNELSWSTDGKKLLVYTQDKKLHVWNSGTWTKQTTLPQIDSLLDVPWSPDFRRAISTSNIKDKATNQSTGKVDIYDLDSGKPVAAINNDRAISNVFWIPNSNFIKLSINFDDHYEYPVYDVSTGKLVKELTGLSLTLLSNRNRYFVIRCERYESKICSQSTTHLVDITSPAKSVTLSRTLSGTRFVSWTNLGDKFLSVGETGDINIWDPSTGKTISTLRIPKRSGTMLSMNEAGNAERVVETTIQKAVWSPDGASIASLDCYVMPNPGQACSAGMVRIWDVSTSRQLFAVSGQDLEWNRTSDRILVSDGSSITQWYVKIQDITRSLCQKMPRNLSEKEWLLYLPDAKYQETCSTLPK